MLDRKKPTDEEIVDAIRKGIAARLNIVLGKLNDAGYSNARIGDVVGVKGAAVGQWRSDGKIATVRLALLCAKFRIDPKYVLTGEAEEEPVAPKSILNIDYERIESLPFVHRDNIQSFVEFTLWRSDNSEKLSKSVKTEYRERFKRSKRTTTRREKSS